MQWTVKYNICIFLLTGKVLDYETAQGEQNLDVTQNYDISFYIASCFL